MRPGITLCCPKNYFDFLFPKMVAKFEAFRYTISLSINLLFLKSAAILRLSFSLEQIISSCLGCILGWETAILLWKDIVCDLHQMPMFSVHYRIRIEWYQRIEWDFSGTLFFWQVEHKKNPNKGYDQLQLHDFFMQFQFKKKVYVKGLTKNSTRLLTRLPIVFDD